MNDQLTHPTREQILARVGSWEARLDALCERVETWARKIEGAEVLHNRVPQAREEMLRSHEIEPGTLPAIAVREGNNRVSFVPLALWVIGANGRVNVTTNSSTPRHRYMLVDDSDPEAPEAHWMVVSTAQRGRRIALSEDVLRRLLRDEDLFAR